VECRRISTALPVAFGDNGEPASLSDAVRGINHLPFSSRPGRRPPLTDRLREPQPQCGPGKLFTEPSGEANVGMGALVKKQTARWNAA